MMMTAARSLAFLALAFAVACPRDAVAQDGVKPKAPIGGPDKPVEGEIARYCGNLTPLVAEARAAYQTKRLAELDTQVRQRIAELEKQEADAREWVSRRQELLKSATDSVVAIYAKMSADAAAPQVGAMDDTVASAILVRLNPRAAGAILAEIDAEKAARLTSLMAGPAPMEQKP
jgi:flagellar motility protein MotE (MotC chaperone)